MAGTVSHCRRRGDRVRLQRHDHAGSFAVGSAIHIPLVSTIRGQRLPFLNVFQPKTVVHYHFAGDVVAAALQHFRRPAFMPSLAIALALT